jgi:hypothetical protein
MEMTFRPIVSRQIMLTTLLSSAILLVVGLLLIYLSNQYRGKGPTRYIILASGCLALFFLLGSTTFRIKSYQIESGNLVIHFGMGKKLFPLNRLTEARIEQNPFSGARRVMGIGGLWCMYGSFSSERLGDFTAYASGTSQGVLLTWPDKKVLVTPDEPERFIKALQTAK